MNANLQPATPMLHHRFHLLDALRGIAALLVLLYHTSFIYSIGSKSAFLAVDFFFCLSGFVIAFSYEKRLAEGLSLKDFFAARAIRLYPTYLLGMLLGFPVFLKALHDPLTALRTVRLVVLFLCQLVMLPNLHLWNTPFLFPFDSPSWSLFFELLANFAFACLVHKKLAKNWIFFLFAGLFTFVLAHWAMEGHRLDPGWADDWHHIYLGIARVALSFSTGVLVLRLFRKTKRPVLNRTTQWLAPIFLALALIFLLTSPLAGMRAPAFQILMIALLFPTLVFLGSVFTTPPSWTKVCVFLGNISYPVYLLQEVFVNLLYKPSITVHVMRHPKLTIFLLLVFVSVLAHFTVRLYDAPVRRRLTRYYSTMTSIEAPAAV